MKGMKWNDKITIDERMSADYHKDISFTGEEFAMGSCEKKISKQKKLTAGTVQSFLAEALAWVICIYMLLILIVMPFYNQEGYVHIGTDKSYFFRQCGQKLAMVILPLLVLYLAASGAKFAQEKKGKSLQVREWLNQHFSVTDWFAVLYGISVLIAYACSNYKEEALIGTKGWYMGLYPQLELTASYFLISRMRKNEYRVALLALPASAVVFLLGILNCFSIYPINMKVENIAFISTIGNINWYCGYLTAVFFGGVALFWQMDRKKWKERMLLAVYVSIGFASLITQGSSSGILALVVILFVLFWLSKEDGRLMQAFWETMLLLSAVCLICWLIQKSGLRQIVAWQQGDWIFGVLGNSYLSIVMTILSFLALWCVVYYNNKERYPESSVEKLAKMLGIAGIGLFALFVALLVINTLTGGKISQALGLPQENVLMFTFKWGSDRGATWYAGWECFRRQDLLHKLVGVGPDCMSAFLYSDAGVELAQWVEMWFAGSKLTNAHNEWLTILVNEGVLGCVCYAGMMCSAVWRFLKGRTISIAAGACGFCVLSYTVNNIFSFQQSMNAATIFIIMGVGECCLRKDRKK